MFVILSGTTCSGKSAISKQLVEQYGFARIVTTTSRPKREGEIDGWDYHFVGNDQFEEIKQAKGFLETNKHGGFEYGVQISSISSLPASRNAVLIVDPNGYKKVKRYLKANEIKYLGAFIDADIRLRIGRLLNRADENLASRLEAMIQVESRWIDQIDHYDMLIQNDNSLERAISPIIDHVQRSKHLKIA